MPEQKTNTLKKELPFKMGADPEFCLIMQNRGLSAIDTIPVIIDKKLKRVDMGYEVPGKGNIGWDGASSTGEIRPNASNSPQELVDNIRGLFESILQKTQIFSISTLAKPMCTGGHIHLELPTELKRAGSSDLQMKKIHRLMCTFYLPILLGENTLNVKNRLNHNYGKITDFRTNGQTYEFRAPTAEWITTPKIAMATLSYLGVVFNEILNHKESLRSIKNLLFSTDRQATGAQDLVVDRFAPIVSGITKSIKQAVRKFELYPNFAEEIEYLFSHDKILKDKNRVNYNVIDGWEMNKKEKFNQRMISNDKLVKERSLNCDIDSLSGFVALQHSNDFNMIHFMSALRQRILVFNWKLKHNYFFFGLRAGIEKPIITNGNMEFITGQEQIKTTQDLIKVKELISNQINRVQRSMTEKKKEQIIFGIPYKDRVNMNTKDFFKLIYQIEKNKFTPKEVLIESLQSATTNGNHEIESPLYNILNSNNHQATSITANERELRNMVMNNITFNNPINSVPLEEDSAGGEVSDDFFEEEGEEENENDGGSEEN